MAGPEVSTVGSAPATVSSVLTMKLQESSVQASDLKVSQFLGCRLPKMPKRLPHPFELLSRNYQLARAMEYFEMGERLIDEIGEDPAWRNKQDYEDLVHGINA